MSPLQSRVIRPFSTQEPLPGLVFTGQVLLNRNPNRDPIIVSFSQWRGFVKSKGYLEEEIRDGWYRLEIVRGPFQETFSRSRRRFNYYHAIPLRRLDKDEARTLVPLTTDDFFYMKAAVGNPDLKPEIEDPTHRKDFEYLKTINLAIIYRMGYGITKIKK